MLGADRALAAFLEVRIDVIIGWAIVAEIIVPIALFNPVRHMHLSQDRYPVAGVVKNVGKQRNIGRQGNIQVLI